MQPARQSARRGHISKVDTYSSQKSGARNMSARTLRHDLNYQQPLPPKSSPSGPKFSQRRFRPNDYCCMIPLVGKLLGVAL